MVLIYVSQGGSVLLVKVQPPFIGRHPLPGRDFVLMRRIIMVSSCTFLLPLELRTGYPIHLFFEKEDLLFLCTFAGGATSASLSSSSAEFSSMSS